MKRFAGVRGGLSHTVGDVFFASTRRRKPRRRNTRRKLRTYFLVCDMDGREFIINVTDLAGEMIEIGESAMAELCPLSEFRSIEQMHDFWCGITASQTRIDQLRELMWRGVAGKRLLACITREREVVGTRGWRAAKAGVEEYLKGGDVPEQKTLIKWLGKVVNHHTM